MNIAISKKTNKQTSLKGQFTHKTKFCHVLTLKLVQISQSFFVLLNTKEDIVKNVGNTQLLVTIDSHTIFFPRLWKSMATVNCFVTNILHNIFVLNFFHFGVNYLFKTKVSHCKQVVLAVGGTNAKISDPIG